MAKDGYYWWYVQYGDKKGWCTESSYQENIIFLEVLTKFEPEQSQEEKKERIKKLINSGLELVRQGEDTGKQECYQQAAEKYEQAIEIAKSIKGEFWIRTSFGNSNTIIRDLFHQLGNIYKDRLNNKQKAVSYYDEALQIDRKNGDKKKTVETLTQLAVTCTSFDNLKAVSYCKQALDICKETGDKNNSITVYNTLGAAYNNLGDYANGIAIMETALKDLNNFDINEDSLALQSTLSDLYILGNMYKVIGYYSKSLICYEKILEICNATPEHRIVGGLSGWEETWIAYGSIPLAILHHELGNYKKAIHYFEQARTAIMKHASISEMECDKNYFGGIIRDFIFLDYALAGDSAKALSYCNNAIEFSERIGNKKDIGDAFSNLGVAYYTLDNYTKADSCFEEALKNYKDGNIPSENKEISIAQIRFRMGEMEKAEETYTKLGIKDPRTLGELNLAKKNYRKVIELFDDLLKNDLLIRGSSDLFNDYIILGQAYEGLKEYDKAKEYYFKAIAMVEEQRGDLVEIEKEISRSSGELTTGFFQERTKPYEGMVSLSIAVNNLTDAFFYSDSLKSRVIAESITNGLSILEYSMPSNFAEEENFYITQIRDLRKQMEALYKEKLMDNYYEREKELETAKIRQEELINRLRATYPEYVSIRYPQPIKPSEIKLEKDEVLLEFEVTEDSIYVFMLENGNLRVNKTPISRKELQELVSQYRSFFEGIVKTDQLIEYKPAVGKKLYDLLFGNLIESIPTDTHLIIVPDEFLGVLPFEALIIDLSEAEKIGEGEYGSFPLGIKYFGDKYFISYAQSATALTLLRTLKKGKVSGENVLVVADPVFSNNDTLNKTNKATVNEKTIKLMGLVGKETDSIAKVKENEEYQATDQEFPRLEKTDEIAKEIDLMFENRTKIFTRMDASEYKLSELPLVGYRYMIFATHGILNKVIPKINEPALVLTQVGNSKDFDGFLTMTEVMKLKLNADVVALTAGETGLGKNMSGEGVMGMGRAFQYAGANNVLMSLWSVDETSATKLTIAFFKYLKDGKEPIEALRLARNDIRQQGYEHPFYWASFVLSGK